MSGLSVPDARPTLASLVALAQQVKDAHEQVAATIDTLAERGGPDAERRRMLAERARDLAELEARHIARWQTHEAARCQA